MFIIHPCPLLSKTCANFVSDCSTLFYRTPTGFEAQKYPFFPVFVVIIDHTEVLFKHIYLFDKRIVLVSLYLIAGHYRPSAK